MNRNRVLFPAGLFLGLTLFVTLPHSAEAEDVALVICDVAQFSCPADDIVDGSLFQLIPNNLLRANRYIVQPINYADPLGLVTFNGTFVTADSAGKYIYAWGTGTATANQGMAGLYLDVSIRQRYVTVPGTWSFSEMLNATCDANATAAPSSSIGFQGQVNNANLSVLGTPGDCAGGGVIAGAGPFVKNVGTVTTMLAGAQFLFAPGGAFQQTITLPFGDDFPNPTINFNDPNNPDNFITNLDIPQGFTQDANTPEPSYLVLLAAAIFAMAFLRTKNRTATSRERHHERTTSALNQKCIY
jgi:hypothetical protein